MVEASVIARCVVSWALHKAHRFVGCLDTEVAAGLGRLR